MRVVFSARADTDLTNIAAYIARDDPAVATALTDQIIDKLQGQLADHPNSGRPGRVANTRELVVQGPQTGFGVYTSLPAPLQAIEVRYRWRQNGTFLLHGRSDISTWLQQ